MSATIQPRDLDLSIFGTAQVDYTVDGVTGCTYDKAVAMAGLQRAVAVESAIPAYTAAVRARQRKLDDLGRALADISGTLAKFDEDHRKTTSEQDIVKDAAKFWKSENVELALQAAKFIEDLADKVGKEGFTKEALEGPLEEFIRGNEWPMGKVMNCLRLALVGASSGLGIADIVTLIGRDEFARRIDAAVAKLGK